MVGSQVHFLGAPKRWLTEQATKHRCFVSQASMVCIGFLKVVPLTERWTQQQSSAAAATSSAASALIVCHDGCGTGLPLSMRASINACPGTTLTLWPNADHQCASQRACNGGQPIAMLFVWSLLWMVIRLVLKS